MPIFPQPTPQYAYEDRDAGIKKIGTPTFLLFLNCNLKRKNIEYTPTWLTNNNGKPGGLPGIPIPVPLMVAPEYGDGCGTVTLKTIFGVCSQIVRTGEELFTNYENT